ncbi:hypothetical protein Goari_022631, partial [Gossypium aridum]|nr:hypothetical protein [Gossypium aridum]
MGESGGDSREKRDEISLPTEELIQLSIKGSKVVPSVKPTLICTIWTEKLYNLESFRAQMKSIWKTKKKFEIQTAGQNLFLIVFVLEEDLELIIEGRPWLFRKILILFNRLIQSVERYQIWLNSSPFWLKVKAQCFYIGGSEVEAIKDKITGEVNSLKGMMHGRLQSSGEEKMMKKQEEVSIDTKDEQM